MISTFHQANNKLPQDSLCPCSANLKNGFTYVCAHIHRGCVCLYRTNVKLFLPELRMCSHVAILKSLICQTVIAGDAPLQVGYAAFGEDTKDIITLNLPHDWTTVAVKLALCLGLLFTFPVMMVPVFEILERSLQQTVGTLAHLDRETFSLSVLPPLHVSGPDLSEASSCMHALITTAYADTACVQVRRVVWAACMLLSVAVCQSSVVGSARVIVDIRGDEQRF